MKGCRPASLNVPRQGLSAALLAVGLSACAATPTATPDAACLLSDETHQEQITLYFGLTRPDGGVVSDAQWRAFVADSVTPRFPDGLTEIDVQGQWRDRVSNRIGREPSRMLLLIAPVAMPDLGTRLQEIRSIYRRRFAQQSVGIVTKAVCAGF